MKTLTAILRFVRFPLVWTAIADSLAGAAVAVAAAGQLSADQLLPLPLISLGLYLFGMGLNDLVDVDEDRRHDRPRPLIQGTISLTTARMVLMVLLGLVIIGAAFVNEACVVMILVTQAASATYNVYAKRWTVTAVPVMAACRVGNILVGWSAVTGSYLFYNWPRAGYVWALLAAVAALTALASFVSALEKRHGVKSVAGLSPSTVILGSLALLPVADAVCVGAAWNWSPWAALWLVAVPLVFLTARLLRRNSM